MQGLMKSNYYKIVSSLKSFFLFILLAGITTIVFDNENTSLLIGFLYLNIIGLSLITLIGLRKNNVGKWNQYLLTLPLKRKDIVKSLFLSQILILLIGILLTGFVFLISFSIQGFPFYRYVDVFLLFSVSIAISLFMGAVFFPISCIDSKDKTETIGIISLLIGIGIVMGCTTIFNLIFEKLTTIQLILISMCILIVACIVYVLSYFLTIVLYSKRE